MLLNTCRTPDLPTDGTPPRGVGGRLWYSQLAWLCRVHRFLRQESRGKRSNTLPNRKSSSIRATLWLHYSHRLGSTELRDTRPVFSTFFSNYLPSYRLTASLPFLAVEFVAPHRHTFSKYSRRCSNFTSSDRLS
jgi:hypothetical protein